MLRLSVASPVPTVVAVNFLSAGGGVELVAAEESTVGDTRTLRQGTPLVDFCRKATSCWRSVKVKRGDVGWSFPGGIRRLSDAFTGGSEA